MQSILFSSSNVFMQHLCDRFYVQHIQPTYFEFSINWIMEYQTVEILIAFAVCLKCLCLSLSCILLYYFSWIAIIFCSFVESNFHIFRCKKTVLEHCLTMCWWNSLQNENLKVTKKIIQVKIEVEIEVKIEVKIQVKIDVKTQPMCDYVHDRTCEKLFLKVNLRVLTSRRKRFWQQSFC